MIDFLLLVESVIASNEIVALRLLELVSLTIREVGVDTLLNLRIPDATEPVVELLYLYGSPNVFGNAAFAYLPVPELYIKTSPAAGEVDNNSRICFSFS
jgi:hypothetical protein